MKMINFIFGYECGDQCDCNKRKICKYRSRYTLHNLSVGLHNFFKYRLHIDLPYLISINRKWKRLSGTNKCPYHKSRNYTCYDCRFNSLAGEDCYCEERTNTHYKDRKPDTVTKDWGKKCAYFEKCEWADDYLKIN